MTLMKIKTEFDSSIKSLELNFIEFARLRLGIVIQHHQNYELFKTIQEACNKFNYSPEEYLHKLQEAENQSPFLEHFIAGITVGETYFFRDQNQMQTLQHYLLPKIIEHKRNQNTFSLRIWSAGCASGEEIYTIAMMLSEIIPDNKQWTIKLLATDINTTALKKAMMGIYTDWSMRSISEYFKNKYFKKEGRHFIIDENIKNLVTFDYLNLNEDSYPSIFNGTNAQDLIICRNVLIYLNQESCNRLMIRMNHCLITDGYLMLGASDPVNIGGTDFGFVPDKGLLFSRTVPKEQPVVISIKPDKKPVYKAPAYKTYQPPVKKSEKSKPEPIIVPDLNAQAIELANLGKLEEAIKLCEEGFKKDPVNKLHYFTYGLALFELNKLNESEAALRKTLFLDNQFVAGHFQLGLLLLRKNQQDAGIKSLKNALSIAQSKSPEEAVPGSPGLCYKRLAEILQNEINLHVVTEG